MKAEVKTMTIYRTKDDRPFMCMEEATEHEVRLLDKYADQFTLCQLVDYMRDTDDVAGISYVTRLLARMDGHAAEM